MKNYIGIDLGGTNVRVAVIDEEGNILNEIKDSSEVNKGPDFVCDKIIDLVKIVRKDYKVEGIGMGFPGPIDGQTNEILMSSNVPGMEHYPLADKISKASGLRVFIDNDANVAGLAEALVGAGKFLPSIYYVTISTGIGGALVVDGKVVSGKHGHAGEIGNLIIDRNREKINHLNAGSIENQASGTALTHKAQVVFNDIEHAGDLFALARQNNEQALEIIDVAAYDLAIMFSLIAHVCDPYAFVIGGGVMAGKDVFFDRMVAYFKDLVHPAMRTVEFKDASLKEPGIVGAAMLPKSKGL